MCRLYVRINFSSCDLELLRFRMSSPAPSPRKNKRNGLKSMITTQCVPNEWSSAPNTPLLSRQRQSRHRTTNGYSKEKVLDESQSYSISQNGLHLIPDKSHNGFDKYHLLQSVRRKIPSLSSDLRKGECGRIAIFGGCVLYTGAAYYCGMSALKTGADSVHIFCDAAAASVIRGYTTELVIHPVLDQEYGMEEVDVWLPRMDCVVVGPGLGKNQSMLGRISLILQKTVNHNIPVIVDGDGLWHIVHQPGTLRGYTRTVITPNSVELMYLHKTFCGKTSTLSDAQTCSELAAAMGYITVISKGPQDTITNGKVSINCTTQGSPRRSDGQGHILSGIAAVFLHWALSSSLSEISTPSSLRHQAIVHVAGSSSSLQVNETNVNDDMVRSGWAACHLTRSAALQAFNNHGRASSAQDIVNSIGSQFQKIFEGETMI